MNTPQIHMNTHNRLLFWWSGILGLISGSVRFIHIAQAYPRINDVKAISEGILVAIIFGCAGFVGGKIGEAAWKYIKKKVKSWF